MFYMDMRYDGDPGEPDLQLTDDMATVTNSGTRMGCLRSLLVWHLLDPVSPEERLRNDRIDTQYQRNRNPFIDRPDWVPLIFGDPLQLQRTLIGNTLDLNWSAALHRVRLESSPNLIDWQPVPSTPAGPIITVTLLTSDRRRCLRLSVR